MSYPTIEDTRLCASVVKEIARVKGITGDQASIGRLTATVARLFNAGVRDREGLFAEAMAVVDTSIVQR
jgi:hypothetical protein